MRLFGHPVHALVVALPIALLGIVPIWDLAAWAGLIEEGGILAYYCEIAGLSGGGLALLTGLAELIKLADERPDVTRPALIHAGFAFATLSVFVLALVLRGGKDASPTPLLLSIECLGAALLALTGWFGGHLVFEHGVAVRGVGDRSEITPGHDASVHVPDRSSDPGRLLG